jgi:hypothetical protein
MAMATVASEQVTTATRANVDSAHPVVDFSRFATIGSAAAAKIPSSVIHCRIAGYYSAGDGGGALYVRVSSQPLHALRFRSVDRYLPSGSIDSKNGGWWSWADNVLTPEMVGAKGDADIAAWTGTDDWQAIQDALDAQIYFHIASEVCFRQVKTYRITKSLHLGYGVGAPTCARVRGPGIAGDGENSFSGPIILCDFSNAPGVAIQGGRSVRWKGVGLKGRNFAYLVDNHMGAVGRASIDDTLGSNWVDPSLDDRADTRYAPYAAFAIDPYAGARPGTSYPDVAYPSFLDNVAQYGKTPSSDTLIGDAWIGGFVVALANQPCTAHSKGACAKLHRVVIEHCKYGISIGNTQSRKVSIEDVTVKRAFCFLTNDMYGTKLGAYGGSILNISLFDCLNIFSLASGNCFDQLEFVNLHATGLWRLGDIAAGTSSAGGLIFREGRFDFTSQNDARGVPAKMLDSASLGVNVRFDGGQLRNFRSVAVLDLPCAELEINGTEFRPADARDSSYLRVAHNSLCGGLVMKALGSRGLKGRFRGQSARYNGDSGVSVDAEFPGPEQAASRSSPASIYAERGVEADSSDGGGVWVPSPITELDKSWLRSQSLSGKMLTFSIANRADGIFAFQGPLPGDVLLDAATGSTFFVSDRIGNTIKAILQNNFKLRDGTHVPIVSPTLTSGIMYCANSRNFTPSHVMTGDFSGSSRAVATSAGDG